VPLEIFNFVVIQFLFTPKRMSGEKTDLKGVAPADTGKADVALGYIMAVGDVEPMTAEDEKRLVRKIDLMVVPLMC
jgi:hypothetical protein